MEIRNHHTSMVIKPSLLKAIQEVRRIRNFDARTVLDAKIAKINAYYEAHNLKSAVVAISGGIDSAVVLGILVKASKMPNSPIKNITAVSLPARHSQGVTGQDKARDLASKVCQAFVIEPLIIEMDSIVSAIQNQVERTVGQPFRDREDWARGQLVSYARTPTYYYVTSVLSAQGLPAAVVGTTNMSEGAYLGYFGKASDGMVDIQLISDLYKSEVYQLARILGVPEEIIQREPTGDMFDSCPDEVVFGAPYDFIEFHHEIQRDTKGKYKDVLDALDDDGRDQCLRYASNLSRMHSYNAHKYMGRSPAVHLDVLDATFPGGWENPVWGDLLDDAVEPEHLRSKPSEVIMYVRTGGVHETLVVKSGYLVDKEKAIVRALKGLEGILIRAKQIKDK